MIVRPTEESTVKAAAAIIKATEIGGSPLPTRTVPRWVLALAAGEAIDYLATKDGDGNLLDVNSWVLTTASWSPAKVKSQSGISQTPKNVSLFPDIFENPQQEDVALNRDYKIMVTGSLKVWQLVQYKQGDDDANSELDAMRQRQAVIDSFTAAPRLGLESMDFEHDELKFPTLSVIPFGDGTLIHIAQGNLPFSFSYVVSAA